MNLRQLQIFRTVCEEMSFTRTAERLYMTQPAVSHVIRDLEEEMGTALFERIARKIYLTGSGRLLLARVNRLLEVYGEMTKEIPELERRGNLRIGSSITIGNFWLPPMLRTLKAHYPKLQTEVVVDCAANIEHLLMANEIDIGLVEGVLQSKELESKAFSSYDISVVCSAGHPLAGSAGGQIGLEEFLSQDLLLRERGSAVRDTLDSALLLLGKRAAPYMTSVNSQVLIQTAKEGLGLAVLPALLVAASVEEGSLTTVTVEGLDLHNFNYIVCHRDKFLTEPMRFLFENA